jgi:putative heme iron utilization protein
MFAENLGKYPPNTALMVITDGKNRYEIFMSSSLTENATIQLRRKKSPQ